MPSEVDNIARNPSPVPAVAHVVLLSRVTTDVAEPISATLYAMAADGGATPVISGPLPTLWAPAELSTVVPLYVVVPAEDVLVMRVTTGTNRLYDVRRAAPFLVEEYLVADLDRVHVAIGTPTPSGEVTVAVIDAALLRAWLDQLHSAGLTPDEVWVDSLVLAASHPSARVLVAAERVLFALPQVCGAIPAEQSEQLLGRLLTQYPPETLELLLTDDADHLSLADTVRRLCAAHAGAVTEHIIGPDLPTWLAAQTVTQLAALSLLQGGFINAGRRGAVRRWRYAGITVAASLVVMLIANLTVGAYHRRQGEAALSAAQGIYHALFPQDRRIVDFKRQFAAQLASLQSPPSAQFGRRFRQALAPMQTHNGSTDLGVESLDFDATTDTLHMQILVDSVASAEAYRAAVSTPEWPAHLEGVNDAEGKVRVQFTLTGPQPK